ncbi:alpha/beta fold hydrolase [Pendulispora brunnea]|uniref:Alpha/beta fold hydrolase n=1 Tax=Pendulispora brunnea TaxID=2905690 RepID=A0ABZ2KNU7_9BACT
MTLGRESGHRSDSTRANLRAATKVEARSDRITPATTISAAATGAAGYERWFLSTRRNPDAKVRLFCFPYAGGSPWVYRDWSTLAGRDLEVFTMCLPGRASRQHERPIVDMRALVAALCEAMRDGLEKTYAFFGHSLGALVAFELAFELQRIGAPPPRRLFVSGCAAPAYERTNREMHRLSDAGLVEAIRDLNGTPAAILDDPEMLALLLPVMRADVELAASYYGSTERLVSPITALFGATDMGVPYEAVARWQVHTSAELRVHSFHGGHFFIQPCAADVVSVVLREVL